MDYGFKRLAQPWCNMDNGTVTRRVAQESCTVVPVDEP